MASKLEMLVDQLPSNKEQAVHALMSFKYAKQDTNKGFFEKENDMIAPDSVDELLCLNLEGKVPDEVYKEFHRRMYESAGDQKINDRVEKAMSKPR